MLTTFLGVTKTARTVYFAGMWLPVSRSTWGLGLCHPEARHPNS